MAMRKFLLEVLVFSFILLLLIIVGAFIPPTPRASQSLLFAKNNKDSLLQNVKSPRIIFIGGSNLSFGLDSKKIKDSLDLNPINTAILAPIGLIYMMDSVLPYIKPGDIVVVASEYGQFCGSRAYGKEALLRTIMDVSPSDLSILKRKQWSNIIAYIPRYSFSKLKLTEYFRIKASEHHSVNSFNEFGDITSHWKSTRRAFRTRGPVTLPFNYSVIDELSDFEKKLIEKEAVLYVTYPCYQESSFENSKKHITAVEEEYKKKGFLLLGTPNRYKMPDSLMFDSPYHLIKEGVDYRTQLLIDDLKEALN
jgi:hypothetical protein